MTSPIYFRQNTDNDPTALLRGASLEHHRIQTVPTTAPARETAERSGNAVTGLVWGTALSIPLWALMGLGISALTRAL